ncbi:hypothetical protein BGZ82_000313 [Podila clonocystis]|nr:hypothetical protein BGZ82_000313 [Podila clonocystis]
MDQQTASRSVIGVFYSNLLKLDTDALNTISIKDHPKWARRLIDAERNRRKSNGDTAPTKAEKTRIISFGEGKKKDTDASARNDPTTTTSTKQQANTAATAARNDPPTKKASTQKHAKKKESPAARTEVDGEPLHEHVANILDYHVSYDKDIYGAPRERSLAVFGTFRCPRPTCRKPWVSGICATVLEFSRSSMTYRTTIYSQKCRTCGDFSEPKLDLESYTNKVKWVLDLWTGNREAVEPLSQRSGPDGPHEEDLCTWSNRTAFGALMIMCLLKVLGNVVWQYLTQYFVVSRDMTFGQAYLLVRGFQMACLIFQLIAGVIMQRYKKACLFVWIGIFVYVLGVGLTIPARHQNASTALVVVSRTIAGAGAGLAHLACSVVHKKDVATVIGASLILVSFGSAVGNVLAGGIWTQYLPSRLREHVTGPYDQDRAMTDPLKYVKNLDPITRQQVIDAYSDSQKLMSIIGLAVAVLTIVCAAMLKHVDLEQDQDTQDRSALGEDVHEVEDEKKEIKN